MAAFGKGVDALSIASPVLKSGPSAYEVVTARMGIEGDNAKLAAAKDAAAKEAAAKQKEVTTKAATIDPGTVFAPHTMMYLKKRKEAQDWIQNYLEKSGGEAPPVDSPEYGQWEAIKLGLKQFEANSKQGQEDYYAMAKMIAEDAKSGNPRFRKDAMAKLNEVYSDPTLPEQGLLPERIAGLYDLEGQITKTFGAIAKEQEAWASQDGTRSGTKEYIPSDAFLTVAETFATDPYAAAELQDRFKSYTPEKQQWIMDYAKKLGTNSDVAMAVDMASGLYDRVRKTAQSEQQSASGYGQQVEEAGRNWFTEALWGEIGNISETPEERKPIGDPSGWAIGGAPRKVDIVPGSERTGLREGKTFVGWAWDTDVQVDREGMKNYKVSKNVKGYTLDDATQTMTLEVGDVDKKKGDKANQKITMRYDEVEGKFGPKVMAANAKALDEKGKQSIANEKAYGTSETGARGKNPTIKVGQREETAAEKYARIKAGGQ